MWIVAARHFVPKGYAGILLFPFLFVRDADDKKDAVFLNHERIHFRQQAELFVFIFYLWYLVEFLLRLLRFRSWKAAYRNISFEREAYASERDLTYLKNRKWYAFFRYI